MNTYLVLSKHYQELFNAETAEQAAMLMRQMHGDDDPFRVYFPSSADKELLQHLRATQCAATRSLRTRSGNTAGPKKSRRC